VTSVRRLRQVAIASLDRDTVVAQLRSALGIEVGYDDPAIGKLGLHNAVLPVGDQFLEVVAPIRTDTTAERYVRRRGGDTGYMLIVQTDEHAAHVRAVEELGVRVVARFDADGFTDVQLHPADTGGAFLEIDQNEPPENWHPAGPGWRDAVRTDVVTGISAAEVACADPATVAERWSKLLLAEPRRDADGHALHLDDAVIRFVPIADDRGEGIVGVDVAAADPDEVLDRASRARLPVDDCRTLVGGLWIRPVSAG
jgi:hypothetical protein